MAALLFCLAFPACGLVDPPVYENPYDPASPAYAVNVGPTILSPANNSTFSSDFELSWKKNSSLEDSYRLQVATESDFRKGSLILDLTLSALSSYLVKDEDLKYYGPLYCRLALKADIGEVEYSPWSEGINIHRDAPAVNNGPCAELCSARVGKGAPIDLSLITEISCQAGTPIILTGLATDPDGDALLLGWNVDGQPQAERSTSYVFTPPYSSSSMDYEIVFGATDGAQGASSSALLIKASAFEKPAGALELGLVSCVELAIPVKKIGGSFGSKYLMARIQNASGSAIDSSAIARCDLSALSSASLDLDGYSSDWASVSVTQTDPRYDASDNAVGGGDLVGLYLAKDASNLYVRLELRDGAPNQALTYMLFIGDSTSLESAPCFKLFYDDELQYWSWAIDNDPDKETVATPCFSLPCGTYTATQSVSLSCATYGASIIYTTDGSEPSLSNGCLYFASTPLIVGESMNIKAKAFLTGMNASETASANFKITSTVATPSFSLPGGTYIAAQTISLSCATVGASIYYTTNGSDPTMSSSFYAAPITVCADTKIKARAFLSDWADSSIASETYLIPSGSISLSLSVPGSPSVALSTGFADVHRGDLLTVTASVSGFVASSMEWYVDASLVASSMPSFVYSVPSEAEIGSTKAISVVVYMDDGSSDDASFSYRVVLFVPFVLTGLEMKSVTGGSFNNGTAQVTLTSFSMSSTEITQAQYASVMGYNPSSFTSDTRRPVENVSWYDTVEFCNKFSVLAGLEAVYTISDRVPATGYPITGATVTMDMAKNGYRLPTEAEWEFAARGGNSTHNYTYAGSNTLGDVAWYTDNSDSMTHAVALKAANELGLYDMSGNAQEWCWDWFGDYASEAQIDPTGEASGSYRIMRGGAWNQFPVPCLVSYHPNYFLPADNYGGFRIVRRP